MKRFVAITYIFIITLTNLATILSQPDISTDGPVIGIDLGTTYSCVGIYKNGRVEIIPNEFGNRITPSIVAFTDEERLVGEAAKNQGAANPSRTIYSIKRLIGRKYNDKEVQQDKKLLPYEIVNKDGKPYIQVEVKGVKKEYSPEEISSMILMKMKKIAENFLGREIKNAVITVPAYFNDSQRQSTKDAGMIAGLNVLRIINEPTAAAIAYGLDKKDKEENILVFDLGGGTFDVSLLTIDGGLFEVIQTNGDTHLGGEDFDHRVLEYILKLFKKKHSLDITKNKSAIQKLKTEIEKAKRTLSSSLQAGIEIDELVEGIDFKETITRAKFEELNIDLFKKTMNPVEKVLTEGGMKKAEIHEIVLVGGSTRIPKIQQLLKDYFNGKEPNKGINPDEAVAYGASIQGGILGGEISTEDESITIMDVTPLGLGIETVGGVMTKIIPKGTVIPTKKSQIFTTYQDQQTSVIIHIFQGERVLAKDNHSLGNFQLNGIPAALRGVPQIEVIFEVDENSIMKVTAKDNASGISENLIITSDSTNLSKDELKKIIRDAEENEELDKQIKAKIDAKNSLEHYIYTMKKAIEDKDKLANKLIESDKSTIHNALKEHQEWLDSNLDAEKEDFEQHLQAIQGICDPIITKFYKQHEGPRDSNEVPEDPDL